MFCWGVSGSADDDYSSTELAEVYEAEDLDLDQEWSLESDSDENQSKEWGTWRRVLSAGLCTNSSPGSSDGADSVVENAVGERRECKRMTLDNTTVTREEIFDFRNCIPAWGYDAEVGEVADKLAEEGKMIRMQACVGPAIFWAALAIVVFWPIYIALTVLGIVSADCTEAHKHWRIKGVYALLMIFRLGVEFKCLRFVTIPYVQTLKRFQWVNISIPFAGWLCITGLLSFTNMMDQLTDSLFVISAKENSACLRENGSSAASTQEKVDLLWQDLMVRYQWPILAKYHYADISMCIWLFTLSQMVYPIVQCSPRPCVEHHAKLTVGSKETKYINLMGKECNLGDTLYQLADGTGMATLAVQQPEYPRMRERMRRMQHTSCEDFNPELSLQFVEAALSEGMISVGLTGTLENMPQVVLQSFVFKLTEAVGGGSQAFMRQTIVSICFSVATCVAKIWKSYVLLAFTKEVRGAIRDSEGSFDALSPQAKRTYRSIKMYVAALIAMALVLIGGILKSILQILSASYCEDNQMWLLGDGCVCLSEIVMNNSIFNSTCTL